MHSVVVHFVYVGRDLSSSFFLFVVHKFDVDGKLYTTDCLLFAPYMFRALRDSVSKKGMLLANQGVACRAFIKSRVTLFFFIPV